MGSESNEIQPSVFAFVPSFHTWAFCDRFDKDTKEGRSNSHLGFVVLLLARWLFRLFLTMQVRVRMLKKKERKPQWQNYNIESKTKHLGEMRKLTKLTKC